MKLFWIGGDVFLLDYGLVIYRKKLAYMCVETI